MTATHSAAGVDITADLRGIYEEAIRNHPRSLQTTLGPSELGTACDRCLVHLLAGHRPAEHVVPWLPTIGTAVHSWCEKALKEHAFFSDDGERWHVESRVMVGQVAGQDVWGSCDVFDEATGTVVDLKIVGKTTLDKVRRSGAAATYRAQAHLYGQGFTNAGYDVREVAILFLPRNAISLQAAQAWRAPWSRDAAQAALARANALHAGVQTVGVDAVLDMTPPHTGEEFACGRFPGEPPVDTTTPQTPDAFLALG